MSRVHKCGYHLNAFDYYILPLFNSLLQMLKFANPVILQLPETDCMSSARRADRPDPPVTPRPSPMDTIRRHTWYKFTKMALGSHLS